MVGRAFSGTVGLGEKMIRVRVEIVPFGEEDRSREIGQLIIANTGYGDSYNADYGFAYSDNFDDAHEGTVKNFSRDKGIWTLISECLSNPTEVDDQELSDKIWEKMK